MKDRLLLALMVLLTAAAAVAGILASQSQALLK